MDIPAVVFFGGIGVVVIVLIMLRAQRTAVAGTAAITAARARWTKLRPALAEHLELPGYRTGDAGARRVTALGGHVRRMITAQGRGGRVASWAKVLPDADIQAVARLIQAHQALSYRCMVIEGELTLVVRSRVHTAEERRIMARAYRRWVLGESEEQIVQLLVDPKWSMKRRTAAEAAVAGGIALGEENSAFGEQTERFVASLEQTETAYQEARRLLRSGS